MMLRSVLNSRRARWSSSRAPTRSRTVDASRPRLRTRPAMTLHRSWLMKMPAVPVQEMVGDAAVADLATAKGVVVDAADVARGTVDEYLRTLHPASCRNVTVDGRNPFGRWCRVSAVVGVCTSRSRLPDHPG